MRYLLLGFVLLYSTAFAQPVAQHIPLSGQWAGSAADEAQVQLMPYLPALQQPGAGLRRIASTTSPLGQHLHYVQLHQGTPIHGSFVRVDADHQGHVLQAQHLTYVHQGAMQAFGASNKLQLQAQGIGARYQAQLRQAGACWLWQQGRLQPAYRYVLRSPATAETYEVLEHAHTSALLQRNSLIVRLRPAAPPDTTGVGNVFLPDPLTSAGVAYGGAYVDNDNADSPQLTAQLRQRSLRGIQYDSIRSGYVLDGPYVRLRNLAAPNASPPVSPTAQFNYTRSQAGFDHVMVYFHIDSLQRYLQSLGFMGLRSTPIDVDAQGTTDDNSFFAPDSTDPYLVFGTGGINDAQDADVIVHEYGHALSFAAAPWTNVGHERRGYDEGVGDYLAASYSRRFSTVGANKVFNWDGNNGSWQGRPTNSTSSYATAQSSGNFYRLGEVWCSMMMELWQQIGAETTDKLQLQLLYMSVPGQTLRSVARNLLLVDSLQNGGANHAVIMAALCSRGLLTSGECNPQPPPPPNDPNPLPGDLVAAPTPASSMLVVSFRASDPSEVIDLVVLNGMGQVMGSWQQGNGKQPISVTHLPPGLYYLRGSTNRGRSLSSKFLIMR